LPGLERLGFPIPLAGHSVYFRKQALDAIGAWDPYNVTEDCDVGFRLQRAGYRAGIMNSVSQEEATSSLGNWIRQRTRWMKGFIQTSIVHLRYPLRLKEELGGWRSFAGFLITVPGTVFLNVCNFLFWALFVAWIGFRPAFIQALFPGPLLYLSVFTFVAGNILFTYFNLLGLYRRGRYSSVKYLFLSPVYWVLLAYATLRASVQILASPHQWEKTRHGDHLLALKR